MPFRYLVSGGVSLRSLDAWLELRGLAWHWRTACAPGLHHWGMFAHIVLTRL